jgi:hypothetical protein
MKILTYIFTTLLFVTGLWGCSVTESENIKTSGVWVHYKIEQRVDGEIYAWAVLKVGGSTGTIISMSGGEHMECNDITLPEYFDPITNYHWNRAVLGQEIDGLYDFNFIRIDEEISTILELPEVPVITELLPYSTIYEGEDLTITWDSPVGSEGDYVDIWVTGVCIEDEYVAMVDDDGEYSVQGLVFKPELTEDCLIDVAVHRFIEVDVNGAFQGGIAEGVSRDATQMTASYAIPE